MSNLPRFVTRYKGADGKYVYRFSPPQDAIDNGIVSRMTLGTDKRVVNAEAKKLNEKIDAFRSGKIAGTIPKPISTMRQVAAHYFASKKFRDLAAYTQKHYETAIDTFCNTVVEGKVLGDTKIQDITIRMCNLAYQQWAEKGVTSANGKRRIISVVFNYAIGLEAIQRNPMKHVDAISTKPRRTRWTQEQIIQFLNVAYSKFEYRNIGLIFHMAYTWSQRVIDIRLLKWSDVDLDNRVVTILQTKRGATVHLPIYDKMYEMLKQQKEDFGFQEYVVPHFRESDKAWRPYERDAVSRMVRKISKEAGLPDGLCAWDLRRTGITEMIESDIDMLTIMSVTGHANVSSLKPYHVNTLRGATTALDKRFAEGMIDEKLTTTTA